jgi:sugar fermentation stimulation protein A
MIFLIQRADATRLALARDIDPAYGTAFEEAAAAGVEMLAYRCSLSPEEIAVDRQVAILG